MGSWHDRVPFSFQYFTLDAERALWENVADQACHENRLAAIRIVRDSQVDAGWQVGCRDPRDSWPGTSRAGGRNQAVAKAAKVEKAEARKCAGG